jgi:hypothetical protein
VARVGVLTAIAILGLVLAGASQAARTKGAAPTVTVTITDRSVRVSPASPQSGATKFLVLNKGTKRHVFAISGPGVKGVRTGKIAPGKSTTLTLTLKVGAYVLSDPVLGTYTSAFLDVIRASTLSGKGNSNSVQAEVEPPEMCGVYFAP